MDTVYGFFYQSWKESSARVIGDDAQNDFYNSVYRYLKNIMFSLVIGMTAFMPFVFRVLINKNYSEAIYYTPILLMATYFSNISGFYGGIFTAYKDTKIMGTTTVTAAILNLSLNLMMISHFGIYAAAISTLAANFSVYVYRRIKVARYIQLQENSKNSIISAITTILVFTLFYSENTLYSIISCFIAAFYAVVTNYKIFDLMLKQIKVKVRKYIL